MEKLEKEIPFFSIQRDSNYTKCNKLQGPWTCTTASGSYAVTVSDGVW